MLLLTLGEPHSINCMAIVQCLLKNRCLHEFAQNNICVILLGNYGIFREQLQEGCAKGLISCLERDLLLQKISVHWYPYKQKEVGSQMSAEELQSIIESREDVDSEGWPYHVLFMHTSFSPPQREQKTLELSEKERGEMSKHALYSVIALTEMCDRMGYDLAVLTAPVNKHHLALAGYPYPGQSEFFEDIWNGDGIMVLWGDRLRVGLVTRHLPISEVCAKLSVQDVLQKIRLFADLLNAYQGDFASAIQSKVRIALCGVNPHASDQGLIGDDEQRILKPALSTLDHIADRPHCDVRLCSADSAFYEAYHGHYDGVLAIYHDQGLAALKALHFHNAVNITWGLPYLRVSPDHGPAHDLYMSPIAFYDSFFCAWDIAADYLLMRCTIRRNALN